MVVLASSTVLAARTVSIVSQNITAQLIKKMQIDRLLMPTKLGGYFGRLVICSILVMIS